MRQFDDTALTPREIEMALDRDRADLARTLDSLSQRMSVDGLLDDVVGYAKASLAAPYTRALDTAVRTNPVAAAVVGAGIAWLAVGGKRSATSAGQPLAGSTYEALSRWEDEGGPVTPSPDRDDRWLLQADELRHSATATLARIDRAARFGHRPPGEVAADRADVIAELARDTREVMLHGLDGLAPRAQDRIVAARMRAYRARVSRGKSGDPVIQKRPIVASAIALALGAVVAAVLPRTGTEDRMFGPDRDRLMHKARQALRTERARAADTAGADL